MWAFADTVGVFTEFEVGGERKEAGGQEECDSRSVGSGMGPASGMHSAILFPCFAQDLNVWKMTCNSMIQCERHASPADGAFMRQLSLSSTPWNVLRDACLQDRTCVSTFCRHTAAC